MTLSKTFYKRPVGIDLFAGAGGLSLGFEQAGFDIAAAVEIDPIHCATHEYNFPNSTVVCASVVKVTGDEIRRRANLGDADIDVVFGGAPCQGFSMIGKRALDDPRNQLVFHYVRLVSELQPKYFVFENVRGLTLGKHAVFLSELITALGNVGYDVRSPYQVLNAADYGVPQDRKRLFVIGARRGLPSHGTGLYKLQVAFCNQHWRIRFPAIRNHVFFKLKSQIMPDSGSHQPDQFPLPVKSKIIADAAFLNGLDHRFQCLFGFVAVGRMSGLCVHAGHKHDIPVLSRLARLLGQTGKAALFACQLIDTYHRRQGAAFTRLVAFQLVFAVFVRQLGFGKYKQHALRVGLRICGIQ
jgi:DNA-cytosine methyltransferase